MPNRTYNSVPEQSGHGSIRCGLYRITAQGPGPVGLVRPGEELVLLVEVSVGRRPRELAVEFWRGDRLRHRSVQQLVPGTREGLAFRLHWGQREASSRLTCRVLIDGRDVARQTMLLGPGPVDAQGRLAQGSAQRSPSAATLVEFANELQRQLQGPGEGWQKNE